MNGTKQTTRTRGLTVKTSVKAGPGGLSSNCPPHECGRNHNETQLARTRSLSVKTSIKAGSRTQCPDCRGDLFDNATYMNHNQTQADLRPVLPPAVVADGRESAARTRGLNVKTSVIAGPAGHYTNMAWASTR